MKIKTAAAKAKIGKRSAAGRARILAPSAGGLCAGAGAGGDGGRSSSAHLHVPTMKMRLSEAYPSRITILSCLGLLLCEDASNNVSAPVMQPPGTKGRVKKMLLAKYQWLVKKTGGRQTGGTKPVCERKAGLSVKGVCAANRCT